MTYIELLQQNEWHNKCQEIIDRDKFLCHDCGRLGFHSDAYCKLDSIADVDKILSFLRFNGLTLSHFLKEIPEEKLQKKDVSFTFITSDNTVDVFHLIPNLKWLVTFGNEPIVIIDKTPCFERAESIYSADYYQSKCCSFIGNDDVKQNNWFFYFKFNLNLSSNTYFTVQYNAGYEIDEAKYDSVFLSIISGSQFIGLRLSPNTFKGLQIHHKYYIHELEPWKYPNDALVTLCEDCHKKRHETTTIPLYDSNKNFIAHLNTCERCGGSGYLPQYRNVQNGICFKCWGEGVVI